MRAVIDTNIWVSFLIGKQLDTLAQLLQSKKVQVISSPQQTIEIAAVLARPRLQKYVTQAKRRLLEHFLIRTAESVQPHRERFRLPGSEGQLSS